MINPILKSPVLTTLSASRSCDITRCLSGLMLTAALLAGVAANSWADEAPSIVINVTAQGGDDTFSFAGDLGGFHIATDEGEGRHILADLDKGSFTVTARAPSGWDVLAIMCHNPAARIDFATESVHFDLTTSGSVPCTFIFRAN